MKNNQIQFFGKSIFWLFFMLGNICLFGYYIAKNEDFAIAGFLLLIFGSICNLIIFFGFFIYGFCKKEVAKDCKKAAFILLINIPIAALYAWIGLTFY